MSAKINVNNQLIENRETISKNYRQKGQDSLIIRSLASQCLSLTPSKTSIVPRRLQIGPMENLNNIRLPFQLQRKNKFRISWKSSIETWAILLKSIRIKCMSQIESTKSQKPVKLIVSLKNDSNFPLNNSKALCYQFITIKLGNILNYLNLYQAFNPNLINNNFNKIKIIIEGTKRNMQESIYNIIPTDHILTPKKPLYKSKYPHNIPPTGSTFGAHTTSKPKVANLSGQFFKGLQAHTEYGKYQTFGYSSGDRKPSPQNFTRKHSGIMGNQSLPPVRNFSYDCAHKRPPVPKSNQKPIFGVKSDRNFIVTNAIQTILSTAKQQKQQINWMSKKGYGQNPQYLDQIKTNIQREYNMIQNMHKNNEQMEQKKMLSQQQVNQLKEGLKKKWNELNREYLKKAHVRLTDTVGSRNRKLNLEKEMIQIEKDIKKLNKMYVFVE